ncbi:hypothetical protein SAMN04487912_103413 [Arthrobacter sp. cf158]|uniref:hypothetical protein n=1 Tax=Arthrobacter sp. cf158 TaxID=1761744 RepID=UPI0008964B49|nr:hypothetical protein [Arthrobacter sp. cf158]SDW57398.1 hypothetical protein SAMN04487912_103413 [Arthrobacter sp. cf158]
MTLNETIARLRAGHLMVRDAGEWDALSTELGAAYITNDDELVEQLRPPFLQSWRTVTRYVLRDMFESAEIDVTEPGHPWGIATLTGNGTTAEPLLCFPGSTHGGSVEAAGVHGIRLMTFEETMAHYTNCLEHLLARENAQAELPR